MLSSIGKMIRRPILQFHDLVYEHFDFPADTFTFVRMNVMATVQVDSLCIHPNGKLAFMIGLFSSPALNECILCLSISTYSILSSCKCFLDLICSAWQTRSCINGLLWRKDSVFRCIDCFVPRSDKQLLIVPFQPQSDLSQSRQPQGWTGTSPSCSSAALRFHRSVQAIWQSFCVTAQTAHQPKV